MPKQKIVNDPFSNMDGVFDVPDIMIRNTPDVNRKEELSPIVKPYIPEDDIVVNPNAEFTDEEYIRRTTKGVISTSMSVLNQLQNELKPGAADRTYEVFTEVVNAVTNALKSLTDLNKDVNKSKIEKKKLESKQLKDLSDIKKNDMIAMTSVEMLRLSNKAKEESELNKIDSTFAIQSFNDNGDENEHRG